MLSAEIKDVVESINIRNLSRLSVIEAKKDNETSINKGSFTAEVFYERLASNEDLIQALSQDTSLSGYVRWLDVQFDVKVSKWQLNLQVLKTKYPNDNSKILLSFIKAHHIYKIIGGKHFWLIDYDQMKELERTSF